MTPESTIGNLCGSRMESVMGITYGTLQTPFREERACILTKPMPSKENTAVLLGKCMGIPHKIAHGKMYVPDQQWEILRVEQLDIGDTTMRDDLEFAPENVNETGEDEYICNECRCAKLGQISDERQW